MRTIGEMLEWLKRHAWKACGLLKGLASSNLALSASLFDYQIVSKYTHGYTHGFWLYPCVFYARKIPESPCGRCRENSIALHRLLSWFSGGAGSFLLKNAAPFSISAFSLSDTLMYRIKVDSLLCPVIFIIAMLGIPAL